jgi:branched-chain amino acid transport system substrate-binding protein
VALAANQEKTLDSTKVAKALENFRLPPEVALMPDQAFYRAGDHQLMPSLFVGRAQAKGSDAEDLFHVDQVVKGSEAAPSIADTGCHLT